MDRPDISDAKKLAAYRQELRGVAIPQRISGLGLVVVAMILFFWQPITGTKRIAGISTDMLGWIALVTGWVMIITAIVIRTRYHKRRIGR